MIRFWRTNVIKVDITDASVGVHAQLNWLFLYSLCRDIYYWAVKIRGNINFENQNYIFCIKRSLITQRRYILLIKYNNWIMIKKWLRLILFLNVEFKFVGMAWYLRYSNERFWEMI